MCINAEQVGIWKETIITTLISLENYSIVQTKEKKDISQSAR
jgi:hypothetical protein